MQHGDHQQPLYQTQTWVQCGTSMTTSAAHPPASDLQREIERTAAEGSESFQRARVASARRRNAEAGGSEAGGRKLLQAESRPLTFHFAYQLDASTSQAEASYLKESLMPAAAAVLSRSLQVRPQHTVRHAQQRPLPVQQLLVHVTARKYCRNTRPRARAHCTADSVWAAHVIAAAKVC